MRKFSQLRTGNRSIEGFSFLDYVKGDFSTSDYEQRYEQNRSDLPFSTKDINIIFVIRSLNKIQTCITLPVVHCLTNQIFSFIYMRRITRLYCLKVCFHMAMVKYTPNSDY